MHDENVDAELIRRIGAGDTESLRALYERYADILFSMALRVVGDRNAAEECVQDAFVAVWRNAGMYDPQRARVRARRRNSSIVC